MLGWMGRVGVLARSDRRCAWRVGGARRDLFVVLERTYREDAAISGVRKMRKNDTPDVRRALISFWAARRQMRSSAPNRHANGNAIGVACGMRDQETQ